MKQTFLLIIGGMCVIGICGYGLWLVGDALLTMYRDWQLGREVRELEEMAARNKKDVATDKRP